MVRVVDVVPVAVTAVVVAAAAAAATAAASTPSSAAADDEVLAYYSFDFDTPQRMAPTTPFTQAWDSVGGHHGAFVRTLPSEVQPTRDDAPASTRPPINSQSDLNAVAKFVNSLGGAAARIEVAMFDFDTRGGFYAFWVYATTIDTVDRRLVSRATGSGTNDASMQLVFHDFTHLRARYHITGGVEETRSAYSAGANIPTNEWIHVVFGFQSGVYRIFANGALIGESVHADALYVPKPFVPVAFGNSPVVSGDNRGVEGYMDDIVMLRSTTLIGPAMGAVQLVGKLLDGSLLVAAPRLPLPSVLPPEIAPPTAAPTAAPTATPTAEPTPAPFVLAPVPPASVGDDESPAVVPSTGGEELPLAAVIGAAVAGFLVTLCCALIISFIVFRKCLSDDDESVASYHTAAGSELAGASASGASTNSFNTAGSMNTTGIYATAATALQRPPAPAGDSYSSISLPTTNASNENTSAMQIDM